MLNVFRNKVKFNTNERFCLLKCKKDTEVMENKYVEDFEVTNVELCNLYKDVVVLEPNSFLEEIDSLCSRLVIELLETGVVLRENKEEPKSQGNCWFEKKGQHDDKLYRRWIIEVIRRLL
ncbi:hypothetical protein L1887_07212 [Cichorium endivia]|nr:hypothetical protein L1887_07212 [Cichorium endivia]